MDLISKPELDSETLDKCVNFLSEDPSGENCTKFLRSKYTDEKKIDNYFFKAEKLAYPDVQLKKKTN